MTSGGASALPVSSGLGRYEAAVFAVVLLLGAVMCVVFRGAGNAWAIAVSGLIALVVQPSAVLIARLAPGGAANLTARMALGMMPRLLTLVVYAIVVASVGGLPITAALVSLASFYFVSSLIEPLLIRS
ncbi:MAG: hypothetical protein ACREMU_05055 [Gemmatimonadaceae bacterium]